MIVMCFLFSFLTALSKAQTVIPIDATEEKSKTEGCHLSFTFFNSLVSILEDSFSLAHPKKIVVHYIYFPIFQWPTRTPR